MAIVVAVVVVLCSGCLVGGYFVVRSGGGVSGPMSPSPSPSPQPVAKGGCIKRGEPDGYVGISCADSKSIGEVLGVLDDGELQSCDPATDQIIVDHYEAICVRHAGSTHVSGAGLGGGVIVPGDCVQVQFLALGAKQPTEVKCSEPRYAAKVVARVDKESACKAPAVHWQKLYVDRSPVLCLATGPGLAGTGQCLHIEKSEVDFTSVPCTAGRATHKVLGRAASSEKCPRRTTSYAMDYGGLPSTQYVCFGKA